APSTAQRERVGVRVSIQHRNQFAVVRAEQVEGDEGQGVAVGRVVEVEDAGAGGLVEGVAFLQGPRRLALDLKEDRGARDIADDGTGMQVQAGLLPRDESICLISTRSTRRPPSMPAVSSAFRMIVCAGDIAAAAQ